VRVLDAGVEEQTGAPFIVMEYLDGLDLGQVLARRGPMPVSMAVDCMVQICEAVAAAHALGIIHRDLKPSNFFLENRAGGASLVKVLDFGISKVGAVEGIADCKLTEAHAVFGTPAYMSPEQVRSARDVGAHSDVWSLGVALFEMLTGDLPFVADNTAGLLVAVVTDPPRRLATHRPDMSRELEAVILACLEKNPARRLGSVQELAARLAPFASADGARVVDRLHRSTVVTGRPPKHASRALAILGVVAVLLLAGAFGVRTLRRMSRVNEALPSDGVSLTAAPVADLPGAAPVTSSVAASSAATSAAASSSGPGASSSGAPADAVPLAPDAKPAKPRQRGAHAQANPPPSASALPTAPSENLDSRY
jgi:serine/threonine-protein kinase